VTSLKKKQIPRCARNDNSLGFGRVVRRLVVGIGFVPRRTSEKSHPLPFEFLQGKRPELQGIVGCWGRVEILRCAQDDTRGKWVPQAAVAGERRPEGRRYDGAGSGSCGCC